MNYETTNDCICGGTGTLLVGSVNRVPCHECIARWDRTHCTNCEKRFVEGEGRCSFRGLHGEVFFCEPCEAKRPKPEEDYKGMVLRYRAAEAAAKAAGVEFERCQREFDREGHVAAVLGLRRTAQERRDALDALAGKS